MCPGFTSDCLETLEEIDIEARQAFLEAGGTEFDYLPCLNDQHEWIAALSAVAVQHLQGWPTTSSSDPGALEAQRQRALAAGATA
jgi:ferrochelatase